VPRFLLLASLAAALVAASGCGGAPPLYAPSTPTGPVEVDGVAAEWPAALRPVPREAGLSLALQRTDSALVVAVIARSDRQARRIALGGLRLWLDPEGGTDRVVGVRFPTPAPPSRVDIRRAGGEAGPQILRRRFEQSLDRVEVQRRDSVRAVEPGDVPGLETVAQWGQGGLVVEARLPLAAGALLDAAPGEALSLGVELLDLPSGRRSRLPPPDLDDPDFEPATVTRWLRVDG
jgi:hypothetical protein